MKRGRERDYDPNQDQRDEPSQGPLWVEPIAVPRNSDRARYGLPALIAAFVVAALVVAMITRYVTYFGGSEPSLTPAPPSPIAWVNTTVPPASLATPTAVASASFAPSGSRSISASPSAAASPSASGSASAAVALPSHQVRSIRASIQPVTDVWYLGTENHFTVELTNTSAAPVLMSPCPVYRMYITGTDPTAATLRLLNCAAIGEILDPGQTVSMDMVYTPVSGDPRGPNQQLVWQWVSPDDIQATSTTTVYIAG